MTECWINDCAEMDLKQRLNAASFLAKLASTRIANDRLCQIALVLFRDTFESERPLGSSNEPDDENEDHRRTMPGFTIASLLPSACAWIREAGHNIILLSDVSWNDCSHSTIGTGGFTFVQSELGQQAPGGFSPWRWLYWLKRLHQIADDHWDTHLRVPLANDDVPNSGVGHQIPERTCQHMHLLVIRASRPVGALMLTYFFSTEDLPRCLRHFAKIRLEATLRYYFI
ncbi:hypothetical protein N7471_005249 [Penicillium samsonianum]|uniref:uncharacterized protein n=1 Tax=Penicillium samsonianum TaxID=1882272 RepID=UPI002546C327|nr:uncharacterized protein N7471_005249 [Penicillium samsonianum]KAJ6138763.1 hypothetical protein N7471_005249 [Penicillium samsonianum]